MTSNKPTSFNEYLMGFDEEVQLRLEEIRNAILKQFPDVEEGIRYNMPAFKLNGVHVYFSAYKKHIGAYPFYLGTEIENEIENYRGKGTKDALHFPHDKSLPLELILKLVEYKFNEKVK
jgi:uncharacterized protein YdhG (YjbR/CyaY superfamily)